MLATDAETGITIGLINAFAAQARVLRDRDLLDGPIVEALRDLADNEDVEQVLTAAKLAKAHGRMQ